MNITTTTTTTTTTSSSGDAPSFDAERTCRISATCRRAAGVTRPPCAVSSTSSCRTNSDSTTRSADASDARTHSKSSASARSVHGAGTDGGPSGLLEAAACETMAGLLFSVVGWRVVQAGGASVCRGKGAGVRPKQQLLSSKQQSGALLLTLQAASAASRRQRDAAARHPMHHPQQQLQTAVQRLPLPCCRQLRQPRCHNADQLCCKGVW